MRGANLALRLLVELAAIAALALWGAQATSSTIANVVLAIAAPAVAIAIWGAWSAPRAGHRLRGAALLALELAILAVACVLLVLAGHPLWAAVFAVVAVANGAILRRSEPQPDQPAPSGR
jgi:HD superfamily phosphodiesterase